MDNNLEIKKIKNAIVIHDYIIAFEYVTKKGYSRTQSRRIMSYSEDNAKEVFFNFIKNQRTMFNVKILSISKNEENTAVINV